jgi:hypothetical protein
VVPLQAIMGQNPAPATTTQANNAAVAIPTKLLPQQQPADGSGNNNNNNGDPLGGLTGTDATSMMLADWMNLANDPDDKDEAAL